MSTVFPDSVRLSIDGPVKTTHTFVPAAEVDIAAVAARVLEADAAGLFELDREFAPSWCPVCARNYCPTCWVVRVDFDEGFYDCTRGRCPEGHVRILDD